MINAFILLVLPLCLAAAALSDVSTMTIPNRIPAILLGSFVVIAPLSGMPWATFGMSLAAGLAVFAGCFALFAANVMGGGDAKLLSAAAVWFGFNAALASFILNVTMMGGIVTVVVLLVRYGSGYLLAKGIPMPLSLTATGEKIPYGIAIAIGGFISLSQAPVVKTALLSLS